MDFLNEEKKPFEKDEVLDNVIAKLEKNPELIDNLMFDQLEVLIDYLSAYNLNLKEKIKNVN